MPAFIAAFWLYGYASQLLLSKYLVAYKGKPGDQHTAIILMQIWNVAKFLCGLFDCHIEHRRRRRKLNKLLSQIDETSSNQPYNRIKQISMKSSGSVPWAAEKQVVHGRAFSSEFSDYRDRASCLKTISMESDEDDVEAPESNDSADSDAADGSEMTSSIVGNKQLSSKLPMCMGCFNSIAAGSSRKKTSNESTPRSAAAAAVQESTLSSSENEQYQKPMQLSHGVHWWWFIWFMVGWLEFGSMLMTCRSLEQTSVSLCQTHRSWAIVFIAIMQMLFDDETLMHSVIGLGLILIGLTLSIVTGTMDSSTPTSVGPAGMPTYLEDASAITWAISSGIFYSAQMFLHELLLDISPRSAHYQSLLYESIGSLYLCWSMIPMLGELKLADLQCGYRSLMEHWPQLVWYCSSCVIAVTANTVQRLRASPFRRSVAFILQLPIVYTVEVFILRWRGWFLHEFITITVFLIGFCLSTAVIPFRFYGSFIQNMLFQVAFYKPQWTGRMATVMQGFVGDFRSITK